MTCDTLRCGLRATFRLVWDDGGDVELICSDCAGHYAARPAVMAHAVIESLGSY